MAKPFKGTINVDIRDSEPDWTPFEPPVTRCTSRTANGEAVTDDYPGTSPWRFAGGTIRQVHVNVSGKPYVGLEHEAVAMMSRE